MRINLEETLFCLVDVQEKLFPHIGNKDELERTLPILVKGMKTLDIPIIVNEQYKKGIGETIPVLKELVSEYTAYEKTTFSGCQSDEILNAFKKSGKNNIVVAGIETHVCVLQTCIDLLENGFNVILVTNCCGSRTKLDHKIAIKRLVQAGVVPTTYESILFELTLDAKNPNFKAISSLIK
ncbi:hydrolase [Aliarcobacter cryaerophilus ATCC 43158]|uniref:YcaC-related amidohydrolase n=1 Tax=Aliarcobacter cryaerophilus ATCC 43158 TaxID=1032070 RepID=A0AAD0U0H7_9BACT|nr:hydrolase [Aliarcobacter cryaerophilus]AYJ80787.1 YcaC-related amidohydrolase [Aliarcobacter cryaerophilus ATCC 43158]PRM98284.1 hydrolase [Aliarcobacter cryaerophilus]QCZ23115.1 hydrolase [Aliarcobacter cryaerophilus ATCC 43158]